MSFSIDNLQFHKKKFSILLIDWYNNNKRDLPWRKTNDPYKIWLSEIILQQTRISTGIPYYEKFLERYPNVTSLSLATEIEILKMWEGLGYYSRARNLLKTAKIVSLEFDGVFPTNYQKLIKLPGIGDYTASAISSFSGNEINPVVDGNVYRFLSRLIGIDIPINTNKSLKKFKEISNLLISKKNPSDYNQAIMDFGSTICKPVSPVCLSCLFNDSCFAKTNEKVNQFPVKKSIPKLKTRYFNFIVLISDFNKVIIEKRTKKDIWKNLYQFPLIESDHKLSLNEMQKQADFLFPNLINDDLILHNENGCENKLTHQKITCFYWINKISKNHTNSIELEKISLYPFPKPVFDFIKTYNW